MKSLKILLVMLLLSFPVLCKPIFIVRDTTESAAVKVVQQQVDAYNARNINAFADTYADSAKFYNFPDKYLGEGKDFIRKRYTALFLNYPNLHCDIKERIVQGNTIIDKENITITDKRQFEAVAIYQVVNGKIVKVFFLK
jgi:hypothetical protein